MSALPPEADIKGAHRHVCLGPQTDSCIATGVGVRSPRRRWRATCQDEALGRIRGRLNIYQDKLEVRGDDFRHHNLRRRANLISAEHRTQVGANP